MTDLWLGIRNFYFLTQKNSNLKDPEDFFRSGKVWSTQSRDLFFAFFLDGTKWPSLLFTCSWDDSIRKLIGDLWATHEHVFSQKWPTANQLLSISQTCSTYSTDMEDVLITLVSVILIYSAIAAVFFGLCFLWHWVRGSSEKDLNDN